MRIVDLHLRRLVTRKMRFPLGFAVAIALATSGCGPSSSNHRPHAATSEQAPRAETAAERSQPQTAAQREARASLFAAVDAMIANCEVDTAHDRLRAGRGSCTTMAQHLSASVLKLAEPCVGTPCHHVPHGPLVGLSLAPDTSATATAVCYRRRCRRGVWLDGCGYRATSTRLG